MLFLSLTPACKGIKSEPAPPQQPRTWSHIDASKAWDLVNSREDVILLDVREPHEYAAVRIPGSLHIPLGQLLRGGDQHLTPGKTYIIVCRSGNRSQTASQYLVERGGNWTIYNLRQGIIEWPYQLEGEDVR